MFEITIQFGMKSEQFNNLRNEVKHFYSSEDTQEIEGEVKEYFVCEFRYSGELLGVAVTKGSEVQPAEDIEICYFFKSGVVTKQVVEFLDYLDEYFSGICDTNGNKVEKINISWWDNSTKVKKVLML